MEHAAVVAANIKLLARGGSGRLKTYTPASPLMLVSMGQHDGVAQFPCCTSTGFLPKKMKSQHLFVDKTRADLGVPANFRVQQTWK
jgi:hypothetical protein